jgi:hypothetical protein
MREALTRGTDKRWLPRSLAVLCLGAVVLSSACGTATPTPPLGLTPAPASGSAARGAAGFVLGPPVEVANASVDPSGGSIGVRKPGDELDGLSLDVPQGAYPSKVAVTISERAITGHSLGPSVTVLSPLISVENGGAVADQPMTLRIPIKLPKGNIPLAFFVDPSGGLEALPLLDYDDSSITTITRHFTDLAVLSESETTINNLKVDTGFKLGADDWNLRNMGSDLASQGYCKGMCLTAMWYREHEKASSGASLWSQNPSGPGLSAQTPHFWQDDAFAIRLVSLVQASASHTERGELYDIVNDYFVAEANKKGLPRPSARIQFYAFAIALDITKKPQLMIADELGEASPHALVCYAIEKQTLYVSDPNIAGKPGPFGNTVLYEDIGGSQGDGQFEPYISALNTTDLLDGRYNVYDSFYFYGSYALVDAAKIAGYWTAFTSGTIGRDQFPSYAVTLLALDEDLSVADAYELNLLTGDTVDKRRVGLTISTSSGAQLDVYRFEDVLAFEQSYDPDKPRWPMPSDTNIIQLNPGDNWLGLYVRTPHVEGGRTSWAWAGFDWVDVVYEPQPTPTPSPSMGAPTATPTATPSSAAAPTQSPTADPGAFINEDCVVAGLQVPRSVTAGLTQLHCSWSWGTMNRDSAHFMVTRFDSAQAAREAFDRQVTLLAKDYHFKTVTFRIYDERANGRFTKTSVASHQPPEKGGTRVIILDDLYFARSEANGVDYSGEAEVLGMLDKLEACLRAAIQRRDGG